MSRRPRLPVSDRPVPPGDKGTELWVNREAVPLFKDLRDTVTDHATDIETAQADIDAVEADVADLESDIAGLATTITIRGSFRHQDPGGAHVAAQTRTHWAGLHNFGATATGVNWITNANTNQMQSVGTGQMAYAIPDCFEHDLVVKRLITRTNGRSGVAGGHMKMGVYANTSITVSGISFAHFPGAKLGESGNLAFPPVLANSLLETSGLTISLSAGVRYWFVWTISDAGVTGQYAMPVYNSGALYPILGFTMDATTPTTIANDNDTGGVGWRHAITYTGTEALPDPFPTSAPAILLGDPAAGLANIPAVGFGFTIP